MRLRFVGIMVLAGAVIACTLPAQSQSSSDSLSQDIPQTPAPNLETTPEITAEPQAVEGALGPAGFPEDINPLTGLAVEDLAVLERRPMVVKISNAPPLVRPQAGIGEADIIFEHYTEGGLTRLSAVFYGQTPEKVGSIRSARLIDHEIVPMFDGILAFSGGSIGVEKYIFGSEAVNEFYSFIEGIEDVFPGAPQPPSEYAERAYKGVLYGWPYYWRDEEIPVPHNMFTSPAALWELAAAQGHDQRPHLYGLAFHPDPPPASSGPATDIDLRYRATRIRWLYDEDTGLYRRYADGLGHYDANTQQQVTAANIIVMYAEHTNTHVIESQWEGNISWSVQIAVWGEGDAILLRDGQRYDARWVRTIREHIIALQTTDGEILYLKPGNTWFQIVRLPEQQNPAEEWLSIE
jgi:hypothetical protein